MASSSAMVPYRNQTYGDKFVATGRGVRDLDRLYICVCKRERSSLKAVDRQEEERRSENGRFE